MTIAAGAQLGPYKVLGPIGAGGMGEVYKALDTRLERTVAIKILPDHLADRAELRERLEREARTVASLNHSHICTLHDIGRQDGTDYLVMEYLEGVTLAQRSLKGSLPLDQVLQYAIEIADALDKAHRKGITHRDLKPGNIMLTKSGTKLLDFGLAKLKQEVAPANVQLSQLPTAGEPLTAQGTIVGTLQYMAPEQLEGKEVDARTDIFAFGTVVYEMATGKKAFEGKSQASLIAKILETDPPPISSLQPMTPPALDRVVKTCLAKDPDDRWQTASDLKRELKWIAEGGSQAGISAPVVAGRKGPLRNIRVAWSVAAVLLAVLALGGFTYFRRAPQDVQTTRFLFSPPATPLGAVSTNGVSAPLAVSPDGRRIAFIVGSADGENLLWVHSLDTLTAQPLPGTEGALSPFWSPDNQFIAFFAGGKLKKIDVSGGPPITICDAPGPPAGGAWSQYGVIVFSPTNTTALQRVSASGGVPTAATTLRAGESSHWRPFFLPDGRHFLYRAMAGSAVLPIYMGSLDSTEGKVLLNSDSNNVVYSQGHLLFLRDTTLMAQPFDAQRIVLTGEAVPVAEQVETQGIPPYGIFSASENGVLAYLGGTSSAGNQLVWFDRTGRQIGVLGDRALYSDLALSPDGKRVSVSIPTQAGKGEDIWLYDVARGLRTRFTFGSGVARDALWSPDGSRIVFSSNRKGHFDLYQKASSGAGSEEVLLEARPDKDAVSWSPDGRSILYMTGYAPTTGTDLFELPLSGDRKPIPFLNTQFNESSGRFSPDGRWVAYVSDESGRNEVYVTSFPGPGGKWQSSVGGGSLPRWRHDGSEIFYLGPDNKLMAAAVNAKGSSFEVGAVKPLFQTHATAYRYSYDVTPDGQRFLISTAPEQPGTAPITIVLNWAAGLKK
jgi:Tol biopolymer transport system component/tRNA A-37 threonylcarbamoyl transferase component Bud32